MSNKQKNSSQEKRDFLCVNKQTNIQKTTVPLRPKKKTTESKELNAKNKTKTLKIKFKKNPKKKTNNCATSAEERNNGKKKLNSKLKKKRNAAYQPRKVEKRRRSNIERPVTG